MSRKKNPVGSACRMPQPGNDELTSTTTAVLRDYVDSPKRVATSRDRILHPNY